MFLQNRTAGAFQRSDAGIGVDPDDEEISLLLRAGKITDVADMKGVETAVGEDDAGAATLGGSYQFAEFFAGDDFGFGAAHGSGVGLRGRAADGFKQFGAGDGGSATLHDHKTTSEVGQMRGFERRGAAGKCEGVDG